MIPRDLTYDRHTYIPTDIPREISIEHPSVGLASLAQLLSHSVSMVELSESLFLLVAFSMGIDIPNVHTVIHWGPPNDFGVMSRNLVEEEEMASKLRLVCTMTKETL